MSDSSAALPDYEGAIAYAIERLEQALPKTRLYHSLWHTRDEVGVRVVWLANQEGLSREAQVLVSTAAYFHDIGFIRQDVDHERVSALMAGEILPHYGYGPDQISLIKGMILATRIPQAPKNRLEEILADADLDVLGREDFLRRNRDLRAELTACGLAVSDGEWYTSQLLFLQQHRYFTATTARQRSQGKQRNIQELRSIIADCCTFRRAPSVVAMRPGFIRS